MSQPPDGFNMHRLADVAVLVILAALVALYCIDAVQASRSVYNLIFVLPVGVVVLLLCVAQFFTGLSTTSKEDTQSEPIAAVLPVMLLFSVYVLTLRWVGFDVGTTFFIGAYLWLQGERRVAWLAAYAISFGLLISLFFSYMLPYPMPMLVLATAY